MIMSAKLLNEVIKALSKMPNKWDARKVYSDWKYTNSKHL